jgi:hypothetical protein
MEKEGIAFWRGFFACLLLSPLLGLIAIVIARMTRPSQRLATETVTRGWLALRLNTAPPRVSILCI